MKRLLAVGLLLGACTPAPALDTPPVMVGFDVGSDDPQSAWRADQLDAMRAQLHTMTDGFGIRFTETDPGSADVVVRPFISGPQCNLGAGRYFPGLRFVEVDPACTPGYDALRRAMAHEVMHYVTWSRWGGVWHVCAGKADRPDCSSVVTCHDCVLSPGLAAPGEGPTTDEAWVGEFSDPAPTPEDYAFISYCVAHGGCR